MIRVILLAFLVRFIALDQSLWLDEATIARVIKEYNFSEIIAKFSPNDFHPPLYYLFMKLWTNIFGYSEISLRFPSVIFSLLAGWFVYLIGRKLKGRNVGIWTAAFFLFNPLIIYYSQEARMYMLVTMFITLIIYYLLRINGLRIDKNIVLCNLFIFLSFLTFYGSVFFIASIYLYLIFKKKFDELLKLLPGFLFALVIISPLLYQQWVNSQAALLTVQNWSLVLGKANIKNLLLIPVKFSIGRVSFEQKIFYWAVSGLWTAFIFSFVLRPKLHRVGVTLQLLFFATLALGFVVSLVSPLLQYFRFLYLIPMMAVLLSLATHNSMYRYIVITGFVLFSLIYLLNPNFHREDWKSLARSLPNNAKVCMIPSSSDPLLYYRKDITIVPPARCTNGRSLIFIPYTADIHGLDHKKTFKERGYRLVKENSFRGLTTEQWNRDLKQ